MLLKTEIVWLILKGVKFKWERPLNWDKIVIGTNPNNMSTLIIQTSLEIANL